MRHAVPIFLFMLTAAALAGCSLFETGRSGVEIRTDRDSYAVGSPVVVTTRNHVGEDLFVSICTGTMPVYLVEKFEGAQWIGAGAPACPETAGSYERLRNGRARMDTVYASVARSMVEEIHGTYRIHLPLFTSSSPAWPFETELTVSNEFTIIEAAYIPVTSIREK